MTPAELERANTFLIDIVETLIEGVKWRPEGDEHRARGHGGLSINVRKGYWYQHSAGKGGHALSLVCHLKGYDTATATQWLEAFLKAHPGRGRIPPITDDEQLIENAAITKGIIDRLVDIAGTPGQEYLISRSINGAIPTIIKYLPNARCGEGGFATLLSARGRVVGVQVRYLDPDGGTSTVLPTRRRYSLEKAPDAIFDLVSPGDTTDTPGPLFIAEGIEDALSINSLGCTEQIIGLPGIGALAHIQVPKGKRIIVVRDGDETGSGADGGLISGVDHLLLEGADVEITCTPPGEDANRLLQDGGTEALLNLLNDTVPGELSRDGVVTQLARLDPADYEAIRKDAAEKLNWRVSFLDQQVAGKRPKRQDDSKSADPDIDEIELLNEPVDLAQTLDEILVELKRYIVADERVLATVALWATHTHLCHHDHIRIQRSPRLAIQAVTPGSGKTTLLECVAGLVPRPRIAASLTASTVLRTMGQTMPCLLIDEADGVLGDQYSELLAVLNAGDRRATAWVERSVPTPDGAWALQRFPVWGAVAFAGIGELPAQQQDRSIIIQLHKALDIEIPEHLEDGTSPELMLLRQKLATWANSLDDIPRPELPQVLRRTAGRLGDNWRILFAIAQLAGGAWPKLVEDAALAAVRREAKMTLTQRLLASLKRVFEAREEAARKAAEAEHKTVAETDKAVEEAGKLPTKELIAALLSDEEEEWATANRGRAVTEYWLRDGLRHLIDPPGTKQWEGPAQDGKRGERHRGYWRSQFIKAWASHLPPDMYSADTPKPSGVSGVSGGKEQNQIVSEHAVSGGSETIRGNDEPTPDQKFYPGSEPEKISIKSTLTPDTPDTPDTLRVSGEEAIKPVRKRRPSQAARKNGPVLSNGHAQSNGHAGEADRTSLDDDIREWAISHPKASVASIAKHFGQPANEVEALVKEARQ